MTISLQCACGKKLRVDESHAGRRVRCPACAAVIPIPPSAGPATPVDEKLSAPGHTKNDVTAGSADAGQLTSPASSAQPLVRLRLRCAGGFYWGFKMEVFVDGEPVGAGSYRKGFDVETTTGIGPHRVEVTFFGTKKPYEIDCFEPGTYDVEFQLRGWTSGFPDALSDDMQIGFESGTAAYETDATPNRTVPSSAGVTDRIGPLTSTRVQVFDTGPLGFTERAGTALYGDAFSLSVPILRPALLEIAAGTVRVCVQDTSGNSHVLFETARTRVSALRFSPFTAAAQMSAYTMRALITGVGLGLTVLLVIAFQDKSIQRDLFDVSKLAVLVIIALGVGLAGSILFVLVPGLFKIKKGLVIAAIMVDDQFVQTIVNDQQRDRLERMCRQNEIAVHADSASGG